MKIEPEPRSSDLEVSDGGVVCVTADLRSHCPTGSPYHHSSEQSWRLAFSQAAPGAVSIFERDALRPRGYSCQDRALKYGVINAVCIRRASSSEDRECVHIVATGDILIIQDAFGPKMLRSI